MGGGWEKEKEKKKRKILPQHLSVTVAFRTGDREAVAGSHRTGAGGGGGGVCVCARRMGTAEWLVKDGESLSPLPAELQGMGGGWWQLLECDAPMHLFGVQ